MRDFKKRLLSDPVAVLKDYGLALPPDVKIKVVEDTDTLYHLSLPPKPTDKDLSEEDCKHGGGRRPRGPYMPALCQNRAVSAWS